MNLFHYLASDWQHILQLSLQHVKLVGIAVSLAIVDPATFIGRNGWDCG